jgi:3-keto-5-aminohexanoate cleavage enzyme
VTDATNQVPPVDSTTNQLIWRGIEASKEKFGELQPPWPIPRKIAIKADIGHHHQAEDVIRISLECIERGAGSVHLHIRDENDKDTGDIGLWREVVGEIRAKAGEQIVIDSGLRGDTIEERLQHIRERLFDVCPQVASWNSDYLRIPLEEMREHGVASEVVVWGANDIGLAKSGLIDPGLVDLPARWLVVPSTPYYGMPMPTPELMVRGALHMVDLIHSIDPEGVITFCAAGRPASYLPTLGMLLGHHARPGLGETHWRWPQDVQFAEDAGQLVADAVTVARGLGREAADPAEFRQLIGLSSR